MSNIRCLITFSHSRNVFSDALFFLRIVLVYIVFGFVACHDCHAVDAEISSYVDSHRSGRDSIWGLKCKFEYVDSIGGGKPLTRKGLYMQSGSNRFMNGVVDQSDISTTVRDGILWQYSVTPQGQRFLSKSVLNNEMMSLEDVATNLLLFVPLPSVNKSVNFEKYIEMAESARVMGKPAGRDVVNIESMMTCVDSLGVKVKWTSVTTLDPRVNYLICKHKLIAYYNGLHIRRIHSIDSFVEPVPGVYVPQSATFRGIVDGVPRSGERRMTIQDISCARPIVNELFQLKFPRGTPMHDEIRRVRYTVDENGNPITEAKPSPKISLIAQPPKTETVAKSVTAWLPRLTFDPVTWLVVFAVTLILVAVAMKVRSHLAK